MPVGGDLALLHEGKRLIVRRLAQNVSRETPVSRMWLAVIEQAIYDAFINQSKYHNEPQWVEEAQNFLTSYRLDLVANAIGLHGDFVRREIAKIHELAQKVDLHARPGFRYRRHTTAVQGINRWNPESANRRRAKRQGQLFVLFS